MWSAVFYLEFLRTGRRLRLHVVRWLFAAWLLLALLLNTAGARFLFFPFLLFAPHGAGGPPAEVLVVQLFAVLLLAVPPFAAGAITEEKALGTLSELLMSELTPWRIVIGKLVSRAGQVAVVVIAGLPLLCWFGGLDAVPLLAVLVAFAGVLGSLAAVSLLASVWFRTTSSALLAAYAAVGLGFAAARSVGGPFVALDPLYLLEPALGSRDLDSLKVRLLLSGLAWTAMTVGCLALAAWRLRPAYVRQFLEGRDPSSARRRGARLPPVGDDPVRWKERFVGGLSPVPLFRILPRWLGVALVGMASLVVSASTFAGGLPPEATPARLFDAARSADLEFLRAVLDRTDAPSLGFLFQGLLVLLLAALLVNLRGAGGISGEREKGTWDALLLAGVPARAMVRGKLLGIVESTYPFLVAYAVPALALGALGGVASFTAVAGTLALLWPAMYLSGAVALERSTRFANPWKAATASLLVTTVLIAGLLYMPLSMLLPLVMIISVRGGLLVRQSGEVPWAEIITLLAAGVFLGWLLLRVARDFVRLAAKAIREGKGELPRQKWLPSYSAKELAQQSRRHDEDGEGDVRPARRRRREE